jgi:menaquinone-dependent protoporphyrinogen oxidase
MHLFYATRDGQSRRIAERIATRLAEQKIRATPYNLALGIPAASDLARASMVVLLASVRYGHHLPDTDKLLAVYRSLDDPPPLVLASVNLTARKPGKDTVEGNAYIRKLIAREKLTPALAAVFAGRLDYPAYRWSDKQIIRFIMLLTGGPTDPRTMIEYTAWDKVDAFAAKIADLQRQVTSEPV